MIDKSRKDNTMTKKTITIGRHANGRVEIPLKLANRHGLITGATGTGKTVTLQSLAEQFSKAGVPVFAADIKGDLSGISTAGDDKSEAANRFRKFKRHFTPSGCPTAFWDIFGSNGLQIRTSVHEMGSSLLSRMLRLNPTQSGAMSIVFRKAEDDGDFILTLDDLRWALNEILEDREEVCKKYGNVTASSVSAIQRGILSLESQGGDQLFGEPAFDIMDFLQTHNDKGVVNLLHADSLMDAPALYATFLLWLLNELFRVLPEVGDLDKPKLVFFFDEAHMLFQDSPKELVLQIERLVRLVRSKGVGVYFITQTPKDVPDSVLAQLGHRVQHALRAFTPKERRFVKAAADAFRPNPDVDVKNAITDMGVGVALASVLDTDGVPTMVEQVHILPPQSHIGPIDDVIRNVMIGNMPVFSKYKSSMNDGEQQFRFQNRMREKHGMPMKQNFHDEVVDENYHQQFVPTIGIEELEEKSSIVWPLIKSLAWLGFAGICFKIMMAA